MTRMIKTTKKDIKEYFYAVEWDGLAEDVKAEILDNTSRVKKIAYSTGKNGINALLFAFEFDDNWTVIYKITSRCADLFLLL